MLSSPEAKQSKSPVPANEHFIVAIGASAGGLEAIQEFFDNMPSNGNLSFIIIQHLSPDYKSLLVELISKHTFMKVREAAHSVMVEKNCVYVIPNDKLLSIRDGLLQLTEKKIEKAPNTAIDFFLLSLAEDQGSKAIAVILSGTGTDGSKGIQAIQNAGGMVLVQDPISAKFDGMPNSAIASGYADYILSPELMPEEIFNYIKERPVRPPVEGKPDESYLPEVLKLIEKSCQYDFTNYKTPTILRRIGRRMMQLSYRKFEDYLNFLRESPEECTLLGKEFLIGVTKFFRDKAAFDILRDEVLPELIRNKKDGDTIKVWVAACSSGEEAYSIAILLDDLLVSMDRSLEVKIFATDLDLDAIEFASKGIYPAVSISELDTGLARKYFHHQDGSVQVKAELRKQIVFARHNILKDPPFIKNDLITCRNMLIYMNNILQRKVTSTLQFSLNKGGFMFLGPSEVPSAVRENFQEINGKWKIYRKIANDNQYNPERFPSTQAYKTQREVRPQSRENTLGKELAEDFKSLLTDEFGFAAVYIDKNLDVREAVGDYKKYLSLPSKSINLQLLKMVSPEVSVVLNTALRKVMKDNEKMSLHNVRIRGNDSDMGVNIVLKPASREGLYLVSFSDSRDVLVKNSHEFAVQPTSESAAYIAELEDELKETRNNLQMAIESLETANEELQSSNEELLSANEELQSSNEELQSLNEELHTLNAEHQLRIKELIELNDDLNNYFRSTEIAQIFVDRNLRIRKFNPAAVQMVNLIESDIGRPIEHISTNIKDASVFADILEVIGKEITVEKEVLLSDGRMSLMRILPYLRQDKSIDGVVISFIDISAMKQRDNILKGVFNSSPNAIIAVEAVRKNSIITNFVVIKANYPAQAVLGMGEDGYVDKNLQDVFPQLLEKVTLQELAAVANENDVIQTEVLLQLQNGAEEWFLLMASKMGDGLAMSLTNVHEKKVAEEKFRRNYHELLKAKDNYRRLNIELEEKVKERTQELSAGEERFRLIANTTSDAIWDWDLVNNKIWWSDSFYNRFGFSSSENVADSSFWLTRVHPDEKASVQQSLQDAINTGAKSWTAQFRFQKQDGEYAIIQDKGMVLTDSNGTPYRMVGAMIDITESERASQLLQVKNNEMQAVLDEFQFVTDFMPQMVWSTQPDGFHDFFNKQWYIYTGLSYEQTKDRGWSLVLHPEDYDRTWKIWRHSLDTGSVYETEYRLRRNDGEYRWFLARALPMKDENGRIIKWFGTCTDIHDQKMASDILEAKVQERTRELQKANVELEASNIELLQFASVASHDLKEPLRKIHMFGSLIKDRYLNGNDAAAEYMQRIITASARMTRLINDLLDFTRLSVNSAFEPTDLNMVIEEVISDLEVAIKEKDARIEVASLPWAEVIPGQIRQVLQNLVSNALKFSKKDEQPRIIIAAEKVKELDSHAAPDPEGKYLRLTVTDNGIGFDNHYADKIFTIFQRLHTREKYEGTGIGLAITKKIIERHNGIITADSKEGMGTTFIITLPLKQHAENKA